MKNWLKTTLLSIIPIILLIVGLFYLLDLKIAVTSAEEIKFSPAKTLDKIVADSTYEKPKNIIFFIADGMGFSHLSLALLTQQEEGLPSVWQKFSVKSWQDPRSNFGPITDSGASGTAMATGTATFFEVIGLTQEGENLENVFELATREQYATGIVTDSYIWDATPAAFVAHTKSRDNAEDILRQIASSDLDLIFGELEDLGEGDVPDRETTMGILGENFQFLDRSLKLPGIDSPNRPLAAIFDEDEIQDLDSSPNLPQLDKPFMLMVESEEMDAASHANDSERVIDGLKAIQKTLSLIMDFAEAEGETLVVFTADHETGGLAIMDKEGNYPNMEMVRSTQNHSAAVVPLLAKGPGATTFEEVHRNWQIGNRLKSLIRTKQ